MEDVAEATELLAAAEAEQVAAAAELAALDDHVLTNQASIDPYARHLYVHGDAVIESAFALTGPTELSGALHDLQMLGDARARDLESLATDRINLSVLQDRLATATAAAAASTDELARERDALLELLEDQADEVGRLQAELAASVAADSPQQPPPRRRRAAHARRRPRSPSHPP